MRKRISGVKKKLTLEDIYEWYFKKTVRGKREFESVMAMIDSNQKTIKNFLPWDAPCGCLQDEPCSTHKKMLLEGKIDHFPPKDVKVVNKRKR